tara:strand:+ start:200 stop:634 length:435 start_codon:yes stop_codon:yes gene_type:complete
MLKFFQILEENAFLITVLIIIGFIIMAFIKWKKDIKRKPIKDIKRDDNEMWEENLSDSGLKALFFGNQILGFIITCIVAGLLFIFFKNIFSFIFLTPLFSVKYIGTINVLKILLILFACSVLYGIFSDLKKKPKKIKRKKRKNE